MKFVVIAFLLALTGCAGYPAYQQSYLVPLNQKPVARVCDASGWYCRPVYSAPPAYATTPTYYYYPYAAPYQSSWFFYWHR